jgi:hypothetical protein
MLVVSFDVIAVMWIGCVGRFVKVGQNAYRIYRLWSCRYRDEIL